MVFEKIIWVGLSMYIQAHGKFWNRQNPSLLSSAWRSSHVEYVNITYLVFHLNNLLTEAWLINDLLLPILPGCSTALSPGARVWGAGRRSSICPSFDWWRLTRRLLLYDGCWCMSLWQPSGCKKIIFVQISVKVLQLHLQLNFLSLFIIK